MQGKFDLIHTFATAKQAIVSEAPKLAKSLKPGGILWISYPKGKTPADGSQSRCPACGPLSRRSRPRSGLDRRGGRRLVGTAVQAMKLPTSGKSWCLCGAGGRVRLFRGHDADARMGFPRTSSSVKARARRADRSRDPPSPTSPRERTLTSTFAWKTFERPTDLVLSGPRTSMSGPGWVEGLGGYTFAPAPGGTIVRAWFEPSSSVDFSRSMSPFARMRNRRLLRRQLDRAKTIIEA